jgi:hypothetical protein
MSFAGGLLFSASGEVPLAKLVTYYRVHHPSPRINKTVKFWYCDIKLCLLTLLYPSEARPSQRKSICP